MAGRRGAGPPRPLQRDVRRLRAGRGGVDRARARRGHGAVRPRRRSPTSSPSRSWHRVHELVAARPLPYCEGNGGRAFLHSQAGLDSDVGVTAGCRVPSATSRACSTTSAPSPRTTSLFPAGISDVLAFDETARRNPRGRRGRDPRRVPDRHAGLHLQPRQQRLHPDHRLPRAQVRPRRSSRPAARATAAPSSAPARSRSPTSTGVRRSGWSPMRSTPVRLADVVPFSWVDGPGNRFVVFTQGCSFDCLACHNPETIPPCGPATRFTTVGEVLERAPPGRALPVRRHGLRRRGDWSVALRPGPVHRGPDRRAAGAA